jgi:Psg1-like protein
MHASLLTTACLLAATLAFPFDLFPRADPTAIWVSVDDDGTPVTTATPQETTVSGTPTLADAPPLEVTGTVFTVTEDLRLVTSTGSPLPAPTGSKDPSGAFARCFRKKDDEFAPFCDPAPGSQLFVGNTYYGKLLSSVSLL